MIRLGIIGAAGSCFSKRYLPLFNRLEAKVRIVAVYDSVLVHASRVASHFDAEVSCSFQRLVDRPDIHGLMMLSPVWFGQLPLCAAMLKNKPLFCSVAVWDSFGQKKLLEAVYQETGATVVVESECRYWPSILRACELQATRLGQPRSLIWQWPFCDRFEDETRKKMISAMLDGISFLLQRTRIRQEDSHQRRILFEAPGNDENGSIPVSIRFPHGGDADNFLLRMECERGCCDIKSAQEINWRAGTKLQRDLLLEEELPLSRQIDHFCRHVSGGLIPLHGIANALWNDRQTDWLQERWGNFDEPEPG